MIAVPGWGSPGIYLLSPILGVTKDKLVLFVITSPSPTVNEPPFCPTADDWVFFSVFPGESFWLEYDGIRVAYLVRACSGGLNMITVLFMFSWTSLLNFTLLSLSIFHFFLKFLAFVLPCRMPSCTNNLYNVDSLCQTYCALKTNIHHGEQYIAADYCRAMHSKGVVTTIYDAWNGVNRNPAFAAWIWR